MIHNIINLTTNQRPYQEDYKSDKSIYTIRRQSGKLIELCKGKTITK